jgi:phosphonate transport system substrate-binding protein
MKNDRHGVGKSAWRGIVALLGAILFMSTPLARAAEGALVLGVFPRFNAVETTTRYAPLADYLSVRLRRKVNLVTSKDFDSFWRGIKEQRYDIVLYNQYHYIRSAKTYRVIGHSKEFGKNTIAGALYVRKDSNITSLAQLRGRTILFGGGEDAMIGYIAPVYMLLQAGLKREDFVSRFAVNPLNSVIGVYHRQADAAGSGDGVLDQPAVQNAINIGELRPLAISEQLLHLPWAVKRTMPTRTREAIQSALIDLEKTEAGKKVLQAGVLSGIGTAEDKDYDPHRRMVKAVLGDTSAP